jgi:hypothetical protein
MLLPDAVERDRVLGGIEQSGRAVGEGPRRPPMRDPSGNALAWLSLRALLIGRSVLS